MHLHRSQTVLISEAHKDVAYFTALHFSALLCCMQKGCSSTKPSSDVQCTGTRDLPEKKIAHTHHWKSAHIQSVADTSILA